MTIKEAYNHWSTTYDSDENLTRDLDQAVCRDILKKKNCEYILEIGCGTGKNTEFLSQIGKHVIALDFSEAMLKKAMKKPGLQNVTFAMADITKQWPCKDRFADLIVCNLVLEHIENLSFIFSQAYRALHKNRRLFVCELHPFRQYRGEKARFQRGRTTFEIQAFVHHISDFFKAAEEAGFILDGFREWWHENDQNKPPRLVSIVFKK
jgi:ubiquinone/menaquinone biosynthesis C-methylase UbiE